MTVFVQSLPYTTSNGGSRFPIETFIENGGDCDDKTVFLAALLAREGYHISILYFGEEKHLALGVASDANTFGDTGYAYIETTVLSYVGIPPEEIETQSSLLHPALVLPIGEGTLSYHAGADTARIHQAQQVAAQYILSTLPKLKENRSLFQRLAREGVLEEAYQLILEKKPEDPLFLHHATTLQYILTHPHDRTGTIAWLDQHQVP
jgi:hypothetical protein